MVLDLTPEELLCIKVLVGQSNRTPKGLYDKVLKVAEDTGFTKNDHNESREEYSVAIPFCEIHKGVPVESGTKYIRFPLASVLINYKTLKELPPCSLNP